MTRTSLHNSLLYFCCSLLALVVSGCSYDDIDPRGTENLRKVHLSGYVAPKMAAEGTRSLPSGYTKYEPAFVTGDVREASVHLFLTTDKETGLCRNGKLYYDAAHQEWASDFEVHSGVQYYIYGFLPDTTTMVSSSSIVAAAGKFANGATLTLNGLKPVLPTDLCVLVGVKRRMNLLEDIESSSEVVQPGSFGYLAPYTDVYMYGLLDHLYANIDIVMDVDSAYNELRTIKLKSCQLNTVTGSAELSAAIPLSANTTGASPIGTIVYTPGSGSDGGGCYLQIPSDSVLSRIPKTLHAYVCPGAPSSYELKTVYDVFDRSGQCVRRNVTVVNKLSYSLSRGQSQTINATVTPTYLYQLSNPDFDNPTINLD